MQDCWTAKARMDLFNRRHTANKLTCFQNDRRESSLRQIERRHEAVMPCPDDDNASGILSH
jgi:hypothetical protein